jgi:hypothetical protein
MAAPATTSAKLRPLTGRQNELGEGCEPSRIDAAFVQV